MPLLALFVCFSSQLLVANIPRNVTRTTPEMSITSKLPERSLVLEVVSYLLPAGLRVCTGCVGCLLRWLRLRWLRRGRGIPDPLILEGLCWTRCVPLLRSAALHPEPKGVRPLLLLLLLLKLLGLRTEGLLLLLLPARGAEPKGVGPRLLLLLLLVGGGVQVPALLPVPAAAALEVPAELLPPVHRRRRGSITRILMDSGTALGRLVSSRV